MDRHPPPLPPLAAAALLVVEARYRCLVGAPTDCRCGLAADTIAGVARLTGSPEDGRIVAEVRSGHEDGCCAGVAEFAFECLRQELERDIRGAAG